MPDYFEYGLHSIFFRLAGLGELSVKQLGHLGGVARLVILVKDSDWKTNAFSWHGSEMAHKELIKMRKGAAKIRRPQRAR